MTTLGERIAQFRKKKGLTQLQLAELCGWENGQARVGNYERSLREPSISDLRTLAEALDTTLLALLEETPTSTFPSPDDYALIPLYSAAGAAGRGHFNDHVEVKGGLVFRREWLKRMSLKEQCLHVIYATGHSMEPVISDGDVVLIDESQREPRDQGIYVIRRPDGEFIIKRLIQTALGGWIIRSDNDDKRLYPDEMARKSDIGDLVIIGRVVWHAGEL